MKRTTRWIPLLAGAGLAISTTFAGVSPAYAGGEHRAEHRTEHRSKHRTENRHRGRDSVIHRGPRHSVPHNRIRRHRRTVIVRPHGHWYSGYGHYAHDDDAYVWLAFTAITLAVLDNLNEAQQRAHEAAQVTATTAPVGETIIWREGRASGSVTTVREGTSTAGRYCREFQQDISVGGRTERAYGTACRQPDGAWEIVSTGAP